MPFAHLPIILTADHRATTGRIHDLERAVRRGELHRVRRGAYVPSAWWAQARPRDQHLARVVATSALHRSSHVFTHESAAAVHDIAFVGGWPTRVHVTVPYGAGKSNASVVRTQRRLGEAEVGLVDGLRVTTPVRTAIDLAASRSLLSGVVALSQVLHEFDLDRAVLEEQLESVGVFPGSRRARRALDGASALSESPLEALVMTRCRDLGFRTPDQQVEVTGIDGRDYLVDFGWEDGAILVEADGHAKYRDPALLGGRTPEDVLRREKAREDAIRPTCRAFVRVGWADAWDGKGLVRRLEAAGVPRDRPARRQLTF